MTDTQAKPLTDKERATLKGMVEYGHLGGWRHTIRRLLATIDEKQSELDALKAQQGWRLIDPIADQWTWGWLYSPPESLWEGGAPRHMSWHDIRFSRPRDFPWATHIIPLPEPAPPLPHPVSISMVNHRE